MAKRFTALSDLKTAFANFGDMTTLLGEMHGKVKEIDDFNKKSAGNDDIGKQYHQTVDQPTKDLTDLLDGVSKAIGKLGTNGQVATDKFNKTDDDLKDSTTGF